MLRTVILPQNLRKLGSQVCTESQVGGIKSPRFLLWHRTETSHPSIELLWNDSAIGKSTAQVESTSGRSHTHQVRHVKTTASLFYWMYFTAIQADPNTTLVSAGQSHPSTSRHTHDSLLSSRTGGSDSGYAAWALLKWPVLYKYAPKGVLVVIKLICSWFNKTRGKTALRVKDSYHLCVFITVGSQHFLCDPHCFCCF